MPSTYDTELETTAIEDLMETSDDTYASSVSRRDALKLAGGMAVLGLAGCSAPTADKTTVDETREGPEPAEYAEVKLVTDGSDFVFDPELVWIEEGGTVEWVADAPSHTATAYHPDNGYDLRIPEDADPWDSGYVDEGDSFSHTFDTSGVYDYVCTPHEGLGMVGSVLVGTPDPAGQPGLAPASSEYSSTVQEKLNALNAEVQELLGGTADPHTGHDHNTGRAAKPVDYDRIAADPTDLPDPINRDYSEDIDLMLRAEEGIAEIEDGVTYNYMTFSGQVPGPMLRVREGDHVTLTLENDTESQLMHNVDSHAIYGPGGGAANTNVRPGESETIEFTASYPGAFIYHCAVPDAPQHIASGMYGLMVVEPEDGLPEVDREFYFGQHEMYTDMENNEEGHHMFDFDAMMEEDPTYVLINGSEYAITGDHAVTANVDETVRVFFGTGGPNLTSSFHPIGNVFSRAWENGATESEPDYNVQTTPVPPGSAFVGEMELPVPGPIKLVDHALTRTFNKGSLAIIDVQGEENTEVYDGEPDA